MTPAMSSTICIGSAYWRHEPLPRATPSSPSANVFGPYFARRASASADVRPASTVTPSWLQGVVGLRACHAVGFAGVATVMTGDPFLDVARCRSIVSSVWV